MATLPAAVTVLEDWQTCFRQICDIDAASITRTRAATYVNSDGEMMKIVDQIAISQANLWGQEQMAQSFHASLLQEERCLQSRFDHDMGEAVAALQQQSQELAASNYNANVYADAVSRIGQLAAEEVRVYQ